MKLRNLFRRREAATPVTTGAALTPLPAKRRGVSDDAAMMTRRRRDGVVPSLETFSLPKPAPGVVPQGGMAMDSMAQLGEGYNWAIQGMWREGLGFLGYPYLAELTQRPEYRRAVEIIAKEMTRRWIELTAVGDKEDKAEKIAKLEAAMERFNVQKLFRQAAEQDGFYGRSQLYIGMSNAPAGDKERARPLILDPAKVEKGGLAYMRLVEPYWSYPGAFNADRPLELDFYQPQLWYVMGETIHVSRLVLFVGREMPDILKPAYQFGGLSLSQMGKPYVDNWLRTRQSVSDLIHSFSVMVLSTDLSQLLAGANDAASLMNRLAVFNNLRDNAGTFAIDKDSETFANVAAPIAGLHELQAQAQEHMASVWGIPLVVYTGITPSGLNASSEGELQTFYAWVKAQQEHLFRPNLKYVLDILQLNEFGEIDPDIGFEFVDLWQPSESEQAANRKTEAETDKTYVDAGILSPEEIRERLAEDADSPYHGLDLSAPPPEPPADPSLETDPALEEAEETAQDAGFEESKHPRAGNGQFGSGGGGAAPKGGKSAPASKARPQSGYYPAEKTDHLPHPKSVRNTFTDWKSAEAQGTEGRKQFGAMLDKVAGKLGLSSDLKSPEDLTGKHLTDGKSYVFLGPNKSEERATDKVEKEYDGDWSKLKDMVRATIVVENPDEIHDVVSQLEAAGVTLAAKPKDNISVVKPEGYRDLNTLVTLPNGMLAELQINVKAMAAAKADAHKFYEECQELERKNGNTTPDATWSNEDRKAYQGWIDKQRAVYDPAWKAAGGT